MQHKVKDNSIYSQSKRNCNYKLVSFDTCSHDVKTLSKTIPLRSGLQSEVHAPQDKPFGCKKKVYFAELTNKILNNLKIVFISLFSHNFSISTPVYVHNILV